jgi:lysophospholipase L1-like esterase
MKVLAVAGGIIFSILLLLSIELFSFLLLKIRDNPRPFLVDISAECARAAGKTTELSYVDPHLGHAHDPGTINDLGELPGFAVYGEDEKGSIRTIRIFALGGSTTDPNDPGNWPKALYAMLESKSIPCQVYNGGVSGYSSNQEVLKMIRDVLPLKPDIVVSLNGLNDLGFCHSVPGHPMVHPYQESLMRSLADGRPYLFPSTVHIVKRLQSRLNPDIRQVTGMNLGPEVRTTPAEQWEQNLRIMRAVAEEFDTEYLCFLQPAVGVGDYSPSTEEEMMLRYTNEQREGKYVGHLEAFYCDARERCRKLSFCTDLTDVMRGEINMYRDSRHPNPEGYRLIAEAIFDELSSRGLLDRDINQQGVHLCMSSQTQRTKEEE